MADNQNYSVIIDFARSAQARTAPPGMAKKQGRFADLDPLDILVPVVNTLIDRTGVKVRDVRKVLLGVVHQEARQGLNLARLLPLHGDCKLDSDYTGGTSLDRFCGSSMESIALADGMLARNPDEVYLCAGVQSMSHIPMGGLNPLLNPAVHEGNAAGFMNMGITAENLAELYGISREQQDAFAVRSHERAIAAQESGVLKDEIVEINGLDHDDGVRPGSSVEGLGKLKTVFKAEEAGGSVTAANSSQITDGASAVLVTSEAYANENNLPIKARIISFGESALKPEVMGLGPVDASIQALERAGLTMDDMDVVELNEAFAAQSLSVLAEFDKRGMPIDPDKVNLDGGAIAIGHPLGASGARITGHLANVLQRTGGRYGLATMCIGGGQGTAIILENPNYTPQP